MNFVVIGASASGINGIRKIRELNPDANITLISKDKDIYSRCIIYHHLKGIRNLEQLSFVEKNFIEDNNITWKKGKNVVKLIKDEKKLILEDGEVVEYDKLLIASGSHSFLPPITNLREAKNVIGFRNFEDVVEIENILPTVKNVVVLGGGLVGIDAIVGLLPHNKNITLIELGDRMLPIQLDEYSAKRYQDAFEKEGVKQYYGVGVASLELDEKGYVKNLILQDNSVIPCELLICATGVRANVEFLQDSGVECDKFGLIFNEKGETNIKDIYGAGDVSGRNPIWPVAVKEGLIAGYNMSGVEKTMDDFFASKATMNFLDIPTMSLGKTYGYDESYKVEIQKDNEGNYKKIIHKDGIIYGALLQGDLSYSGILTQLIRSKINIEKVKKPIFDIDYSDFFNETENFEFTYDEVENVK